MAGASVPLFLVLAGLFPHAVDAQEIRGRVLEDVAGEPVPGVFVSLLSVPSGERADAALTTSDGTYLLRAPAPGRYRIRAERIGYEGREVGPVEVGEGETLSRELRIPVRPVRIEALRVTVEGRCRRPSEAAGAVLRLWEDARAVLRTARWAERQERYRFTLLQYQETVVRPSGRIVEARARRRPSVRGAPFRSLPAEELARSGFRQVRGDTARYLAPDADVLLSEAFLDTHCLSVAPGEEAPADGLVGLSFRPSGEWGPVDVRGTFWFSLDPIRLRELRFAYTGLDRERGAAGEGSYPYGGRIGYRRVPDGGWIVDEWQLRMPHERPPDDEDGTVAAEGLEEGSHEAEAEDTVPGAAEGAARAHVEAGGRVERIVGPGGPVAREPAGGTVSGYVLDDLSGAVASGVRVLVPGTGRWTVTGRTGSYELRGVPAGARELRVVLPLTELAGTGTPVDSVVVRDGRRVRVDFTTPSPDALVDRLCPEDRDPSILLVGWVTDRRGRPLGGAAVTASWTHQELSVSAGGRPHYSRGIRNRQTRARPDGTYLLCGVTYDQRVEVRAEWRGADGPATAVVTPSRGVARGDPVVEP